MRKVFAIFALILFAASPLNAAVVIGPTASVINSALAAPVLTITAVSKGDFLLEVLKGGTSGDIFALSDNGTGSPATTFNAAHAPFNDSANAVETQMQYAFGVTGAPTAVKNTVTGDSGGSSTSTVSLEVGGIVSGSDPLDASGAGKTCVSGISCTTETINTLNSSTVVFTVLQWVGGAGTSPSAGAGWTLDVSGVTNTRISIAHKVFSGAQSVSATWSWGTARAGNTWIASFKLAGNMPLSIYGEMSSAKNRKMN